MAAKNELRQCDHCGKEFKPRVNTQRFCQKQCRWDYNNALKFQDTDKRVDSMYTPLHVSDTITPVPIEKPRKTQTDGSQGDVVTELRSMIKLLKKQIEIYEKQIGIQQQMLDYFLSSGVGIVPADTPRVPFQKPLIIDDDLPVVDVKKSTKAGQSNQNFLNSIMALNG